MEKLKGIWNNMIFIMIKKLEKNEEMTTEQEKQEFYYLHYIEKITEYYV